MRNYLCCLLLVLSGFWAQPLLAKSADTTAPEVVVAEVAPAPTAIDLLLEKQKGLEKSFSQVEKAEGEGQLFYEAVLRRKLQNLHAEIENEVDANKDPQPQAFETLLKRQEALLVKLITLSEKQVVKLSSARNKSDGSAKDIFELELQQRIVIMDTYYNELTDTILWGKKLGFNFTSEEENLKETLTMRADFLLDVLLYLNAQKKEVKQRLQYVNEADKAEVLARQSRLKESSHMFAVSLEATTSMMEKFGLNVSEYKQVLLVTTGDINADVLDVNVAGSLLKEWGEAAKTWMLASLPSILVKLALFIAILYVARVISRLLSSAVRRSVSHSKMQFSVLMQDFFVSITTKAVFLVGLFIALSQIGIEVGPLLTGFGVAGIIVGFALQDTLSNFASGMMILIYRPYDVKDLVQVAGYTGTVKRMSLVSTTIQTIDNQRLVIPNNKIWGDVINNITAETIRRVDMVFGIGYADDIDRAKEVLMGILMKHEHVLKTPEPVVRLHTLNSSSVDFVVRPWVKTDYYWDVYWDVTEAVKKRFDEEGISIPFPQQDVHLHTVIANKTDNLVDLDEQ